MSLVVDGLLFGRDDFRAGPLSLVATPGSFVALIGPNGGGKTTLLKTLAGLLPALGGRILMPGGSDAPLRAYLPPPGALSIGLPTEHVVALGRAAGRGWSPVLSAGDRDAARRALDRLGVGDLAPRAFDRLSSGQQQLALVARLLVQDAYLCLLDEPTALLDPPHAARVERAIRLLTDAGGVVVASSHHLSFAAQADQVVTIGASIAVGSASDLLGADALSALYGAEITLCPCCRQPIAQSATA